MRNLLYEVFQLFFSMFKQVSYHVKKIWCSKSGTSWLYIGFSVICYIFIGNFNFMFLKFTLDN